MDAHRDQLHDADFLMTFHSHLLTWRFLLLLISTQASFFIARAWACYTDCKDCNLHHIITHSLTFGFRYVSITVFYSFPPCWPLNANGWSRVCQERGSCQGSGAASIRESIARWPTRWLDGDVQGQSDADLGPLLPIN